MKKYLFIIVFLIPFYVLNAQTDSETTNSNPIFIGIGYERFIANLTPVNMFALDVELFVSNELSLNYNFSLGILNSKVYIHSYAGLPAALYLMLSNIGNENTANSSSDILNYISFLLIFVPEGISYHFPMDNKMSLVPYINPLGYEFLGDVNSFSSSIGMKMKINPISDLFIVPYVGIKYLYNLKMHAYNIGATAGLKF